MHVVEFGGRVTIKHHEPYRSGFSREITRLDRQPIHTFWPLTLGHIGPYISGEHPKHKTHPVFGYAGFVIPVDAVRPFGGFFEFTKENLLGWEIARAKAHPRRWEKKGSALLTTRNQARYASEVNSALTRLSKRLRADGGHPVYFGQVKPRGGPETISETAADRSGHMLINAVRQLATYADQRDERIMIFLDAVDDAPRLEAVQRLGGYIYKASEPALHRVVEVPMQLESKHYGNVQFADWIAAIVTRTTDFHFARNMEFSWSPALFRRTIGAAKCDVGSYVKTSPDPKNWSKVHARDLCSDRAWAFDRKPTPDTKRPVRSRRRDEPPRLTHSIGATSPELTAFYESLRPGIADVGGRP